MLNKFLSVTWRIFVIGMELTGTEEETPIYIATELIQWKRIIFCSYPPSKVRLQCKRKLLIGDKRVS